MSFYRFSQVFTFYIYKYTFLINITYFIRYYIIIQYYFYIITNILNYFRTLLHLILLLYKKTSPIHIFRSHLTVSYYLHSLFSIVFAFAISFVLAITFTSLLFF